MRGTVCRRIRRRIAELGLSDIADYAAYLETHPEEWERLDAFCRIPISRFWRDRGVFETLAGHCLPDLAARIMDTEGAAPLKVWSAGCASGEEVYTLSILWKMRLAARFPDIAFSVVGTDVDPTMIDRAERACYQSSSLKEVPRDCREAAFRRHDDEFCVTADYRQDVAFRRQDIRREMPAGPFHLILCRNVIFTYFAPALQEELLPKLVEHLAAGGYLVIGAHERLPAGTAGLTPWGSGVPIYRKPEA